MDRLLSRLVRRAFRQGVLRGDSKWVIVGAGALVARLALRAFRKKPEVVYSGVLRTGERLVISQLRHNGPSEGPAAQP
jgi:hypothetical protein